MFKHFKITYSKVSINVDEDVLVQDLNCKMLRKCCNNLCKCKYMLVKHAVNAIRTFQWVMLKGNVAECKNSFRQKLQNIEKCCKNTCKVWKLPVMYNISVRAKEQQ